MSKIAIMIDMGAPHPGAPAPTSTAPEKTKKMSIEEEVRKSIQLIESGYNSKIEFTALRGLYTSLVKMKQTDRIKNLRNMIKPVLSKFGYHVE